MSGRSSTFCAIVESSLNACCDFVNTASRMREPTGNESEKHDHRAPSRNEVVEKSTASMRRFPWGRGRPARSFFLSGQHARAPRRGKERRGCARATALATGRRAPAVGAALLPAGGYGETTMSLPGPIAARVTAYRALAAQNFALAQHAATPQLRQWFLDIGNCYAKMAAQVERQGAPVMMTSLLLDPRARKH